MTLREEPLCHLRWELVMMRCRRTFGESGKSTRSGLANHRARTTASPCDHAGARVAGHNLAALPLILAGAAHRSGR